jgi:hypothetical protein
VQPGNLRRDLDDLDKEIEQLQTSLKRQLEEMSGPSNGKRREEGKREKREGKRERRGRDGIGGRGGRAGEGRKREEGEKRG